MKTDRKTKPVRRASKKASPMPGVTSSPAHKTEADVQRLIHELQVRQIELEMQNEELAQARAESEAALHQYTDLYDFAPVGYFTLARDGTIRQANSTGANLLGAERGKLVKRRFGVFVSPASRPALSVFLEKVFSTNGEEETCEVELLNDKTESLWAHIEAVSDDSRETCRVVVNDITARKQAEDALEESGEKYSGLSEASFEAIFISEKGICLEQNQTAERMFGYSDSEAIGRSGTEWISPEDRDTVLNNMLSGYEKPYEVTALRKDGYTFPAMIRGKMMHYKGRTVRVTSLQDITERKQAEDALRGSEERYRNIVENSTVGIYRSTPEGRYLSLNPAMAHIYGFASTEEMNASITDIAGQIHVDPARRQAFMQMQAEQGHVTGFVNQNYRKDGSIIWTSTNSRVVKDPEGNILYYEGFMTDITERKQAEEMLHESEERYRNLVEMSPDAIAVHQQGKFVYVNPAGGELVGARDPRELVGKSVLDIVHPAYREIVVQRFRQTTEGEKAPLMEEKFIKLDGTPIDVEVAAIPLTYQGKPATQVVVRDITERKRAEEELRRSASALERAQRMAHVGSWTWHIQSNQLEWSDEMYHIFGIEKDGFSGDLGDVMGRAIHPDDRAKVEQSNLSVIQEKRSLPLEYRVIWPDGRVRVVWAEAGELTLDKNGNPAVLAGIAQDITARKGAEEALRRHAESLQKPQPPVGEKDDAELAERLPQICAAITVGIALLASTGWLANLRLLAGQWGTYIPMAPSAALAFLLLGGALFFHARLPAQRLSRIFALVAVSLVSLLGLLVLAQFITGMDLGVERALSGTSEWMGNIPLGRMSPLSAASFLFESAAILILLIVPRWHHAATTAVLLAVSVTVISFIVLVGYAYGAPLLYGGQIIPMSFPTAAAFVASGIGLLRMTFRNSPFFRLWSRISLQGRLLRAFAFPLVGFIFLEGWLETRFDPFLPGGQHVLWQTLMALVLGGLMVVLIGWVAHRAGETEEQSQAQINSLARFPDESPHPVLRFTREGRLIYANRNSQRLLEYWRYEKPNEFLPEAERRLIAEALLRGDNRLEEVACGGTIYSLLFVPIEEMDYVNIYGRDITARKRAEETLRESESFSQALLNNSPIGISVRSRTGQLLSANAAWKRIWAIPESDLQEDVTRDRQSLNFDERDNYLKSHQEDVRRVYEQGGYLHLPELKPAHPRPNAAEWISQHFYAIQDAQGQVARVVILTEDITERKRAEDALRQSEAKYRSLFDNIPDGVYQTTPDGHILSANPALVKNLGYEAEQDLFEINVQTELYVHPGDREKFQQLMEEQGEAQNLELLLRRKDGAGIVVLENSRAVRDEQGHILYYEGVLTDITERKRAEEELNQRVAELELLYESGLALSQSLNPKEIGQKILELLKANLNWHHTRIRLYHQQEDRLELLDFNQPGLNGEVERREVVERFQNLITRPSQGLSGWVILHGQPVRSGDVGHDPRYIESTPGIHSGLYVPMKLGEHIVGVISIESEEANAFSEADERLIVTLAHQAQSAFENARLFADNVSQLETLTNLYTSAQKLTHTLDLEEMAGDVARTCVDVFGAKLAWIGRAETNGRVSVLAHYPAGNNILQSLPERWDESPAGQGPTGRAIRSGFSNTIADIASDSNFEPWRAGALAQGFQTVGSFPLISRARPFGVLTLYSDQADFFTPERIEFFNAYANLPAAALENARLFAETEHRLNQVQALRTIDQAIGGNLDVRLILNIIVEQSLTHLHADAADILLYDAQALNFAAGRGFRTQALQHTHLRLGEGFAGRVALEKQVVIISDFESRITDYPQPAIRNLQAEGFVVYCGVPLIAKGQVKGVLEIFHRTSFEPGEEWMDFMEALAGQAAIAIDNIALFDDLQRSNAELGLAYEATIEGWSRALDLRDKETEGHTQRVAEVTLRLARGMGLSEGELVHVRRGALLHDIGKMGIPDSILLKPGPLTDEEWGIMRKHPQYAFEMLSPIVYLLPALDIPYCHHEKWDGSGYPRGLKGEQIPLAARIFAIIDVWDALCSDRPYRPAWPEQKVLEYLQTLAGAHFDPNLLQTFVKALASSGGI
jgi:PAS domain S-box-containing protein